MSTKSVAIQYDDKVEAYGAENEVYFDANRNLRKLPCHIELNTDLNKLVMNAVCNLAKNFNLQS